MRYQPGREIHHIMGEEDTQVAIEAQERQRQENAGKQVVFSERLPGGVHKRRRESVEPTQTPPTGPAERSWKEQVLDRQRELFAGNGAPRGTRRSAEEQWEEMIGNTSN